VRVIQTVGEMVYRAVVFLTIVLGLLGLDGTASKWLNWGEGMNG
jgi:hypothetical protein